MYSAVEVADFVVDHHLHHGCVVEQCILVRWSICRQIPNCGDNLSWKGYFWRFVFSFNDIFNEIHLLFFSLLPGSTFVVSLSVKHVINLIWPYSLQ